MEPGRITQYLPEESMKTFLGTTEVNIYSSATTNENYYPREQLRRIDRYMRSKCISHNVNGCMSVIHSDIYI